MANYDTIVEAINADTTNMTVLRDHVKNDDSVSTYATNIDWFKFNNVTVSNIYSSGNSFLGLGTNAEQLLVNRRDCAVWDEYSESGMIGGNRFFKFKWCGVSAYNADPTTEATQQWYDVFLLDNGQIYLYFYVVPTSGCTGDNVLVCGNSTVRFTVNEGTPCEYTFKAADATAGTGWFVVSGKPTIDPAPEPKPTPAVVYNFLPGRYRAFVRTTYINGLNETKTCTSNAYEFSNNTPVITDAFMGTGATWDGSEVEIAWSGDYNSLTVQISNAHIVFKMYINSTLIYTFTSPVGTSTTDIDKISVGFLIDDENEVAKPSFIYDNGNDTYQYNQEAPTDAEMGLIYEWLSGGYTPSDTWTEVTPDANGYILDAHAASDGFHDRISGRKMKVIDGNFDNFTYDSTNDWITFGQGCDSLFGFLTKIPEDLIMSITAIDFELEGKWTQACSSSALKFLGRITLQSDREAYAGTMDCVFVRGGHADAPALTLTRQNNGSPYWQTVFDSASVVYDGVYDHWKNLEEVITYHMDLSNGVVTYSSQHCTQGVGAGTRIRANESDYNNIILNSGNYLKIVCGSLQGFNARAYRIKITQ